MPQSGDGRVTLLQQITRPDAWRQGFSAAGVADTIAQSVAAAVAGMGVVHTLALPEERHCYLVQPEGSEACPKSSGIHSMAEAAVQRCKQRLTDASGLHRTERRVAPLVFGLVHGGICAVVPAAEVVACAQFGYAEGR